MLFCLSQNVQAFEHKNIIIDFEFPTYVSEIANRNGALSIKRRGLPQVLLSEDFQQRWPGLEINAILMHEYCHLDLKHSSNFDLSDSIIEVEADCCAAQRLTALGHKDVITAIQKYYTGQAKSQLTEIQSVGRSGHLGGEVRAHLYQYCSENLNANTEDIANFLQEKYSIKL